VSKLSEWHQNESLKIWAKSLKSLLERVKGIEPSYSAWKSPEFRNVSRPVPIFHSFWAIEVATEFPFVGMATASPCASIVGACARLTDGEHGGTLSAMAHVFCDMRDTQSMLSLIAAA
jgi:hypothetical protein